MHTSLQGNNMHFFLLLFCAILLLEIVIIFLSIKLLQIPSFNALIMRHWWPEDAALDPQVDQEVK